jgi:hypothetical protein
MDSWVLPFVIAVVVLVVLAAVIGKRGAGVGLLYQAAKALFSPAERSFLGILDQAVGAEYRVFGKVRVADIASVKSGLKASARQRALNRIAAKHFDFIVCRVNDLSVVCAVELNDKSHSGKRVQARDKLIADVCRSINLPLFVVSAKAAYSLQEVREQFVMAISAPAGDRSVA